MKYIILITEKLELTTKNIKFCMEIFENINRKYSSQVTLVVKEHKIWVAITKSHFNYCKHYVLKNCKIKSYED